MFCKLGFVTGVHFLCVYVLWFFYSQLLVGPLSYDIVWPYNLNLLVISSTRTFCRRPLNIPEYYSIKVYKALNLNRIVFSDIFLKNTLICIVLTAFLCMVKKSICNRVHTSLLYYWLYFLINIWSYLCVLIIILSYS